MTPGLRQTASGAGLAPVLRQSGVPVPTWASRACVGVTATVALMPARSTVRVC